MSEQHPRVGAPLPRGAPGGRSHVCDPAYRKPNYEILRELGNLRRECAGSGCPLLRDCYVQGVGPRPAGAMCLGVAHGSVPDHLPYE